MLNTSLYDKIRKWTVAKTLLLIRSPLPLILPGVQGPLDAAAVWAAGNRPGTGADTRRGGSGEIAAFHRCIGRGAYQFHMEAKVAMITGSGFFSSLIANGVKAVIFAVLAYAGIILGKKFRDSRDAKKASSSQEGK